MAPTEPAVGIAPGDKVAGKYLVERFIGEGGMGVVAVARHVITRERVALKVLKPEALTHGGAVQRFINEARAAVRIKSEHVARVIDVDFIAEHTTGFENFIDANNLNKKATDLYQAYTLTVKQIVGSSDAAE